MEKTTKMCPRCRREETRKQLEFPMRWRFWCTVCDHEWTEDAR